MKFRKFVFFALATVLFSACLSPRTDHTRYYLLSTPTPAPTTASVESDKVFLVGLRMTSVEYLRTKQMLVEFADIFGAPEARDTPSTEEPELAHDARHIAVNTSHQSLHQQTGFAQLGEHRFNFRIRLHNHHH